MLVPLGRPDADEVPAESFKNLCPEPVPIAGNPGRPVVRAVAEDSRKIHSRFFGVFHGNIDPESGTPDILRNRVVVVLQQPRDGVTEQSCHVVGRIPACLKRRAAVRGIGQEGGKCGDTGRRSRFDCEIRAPEVGKDHTAFACTGD